MALVATLEAVYNHKIREQILRVKLAVFNQISICHQIDWKTEFSISKHNLN
jgi:hypothetical protein